MLIQDQNLERPVILGRIKIGDKSGKKGAPQKFDHFRVYKGAKDSDGQPVHDAEFQKELEGKYGKPLTRIPIFLMYNTLEANFDSRYAFFSRIDGQATCLCFGDGREAQRVKHQKKDGGVLVERDKRGNLLYEPHPCPCELFSLDPKADRKAHPCKMSGKLMFQLKDYPMGGGVFLFRTHSYHSVHRLSWALRQMSDITLENMAGIPIELVLESQRTQRNMEIFVVRLQWSFAADQLQLRAIEQVKRDAEFRKLLTMREARGALLLNKLDDEDGEQVVDEFYSTQADGPKALTEPPEEKPTGKKKSRARKKSAKKEEPSPEPKTEAKDEAEDELAAMTGKPAPEKEPEAPAPAKEEPPPPEQEPVEPETDDGSSDFELF